MGGNSPRIDQGGDLNEILFVEDNPGDVRLVREAFKQAEVDVEVRIATDGVDAIAELSHRRNQSESLPELVLLDLNIPRMDGLEFLDALRDDPALSHLPILVLTSSTDDEDVVRCYAKSANAYLTKPESPDELVSLADAVVSFWIERAKFPAEVR